MFELAQSPLHKRVIRARNGVEGPKVPGYGFETALVYRICRIRAGDTEWRAEELRLATRYELDGRDAFLDLLQRS